MKAAEKTRFWRDFVNARVIHSAATPVVINGQWATETELRDVRLLSVVQCWAMVRRPKAMPYVCHIDELRCR